MPQLRNPTIKDVADRAGVHQSTASRALSSHSSIPSATRKRIRALADEIGYRINPLTAALMKSRRRRSNESLIANLGMIVPNSRTSALRPRSWIEEVYTGAKEEAAKLGYKMELFSTADAGGTPEAFERTLVARSIQGLILAPEHEAPIPFNLDWSKFSVISLQNGPSKIIPRFNQLGSNHFHSMLELCRSCRKLGYRRLGLVLRDHPETHLEYGRIVYGAFTSGIAESDELMPVPPLIVRELDTSQITSWAKQHRVDAIIQAGGGFTPEFDPPEFRSELCRNGIKIPTNIGLVVMAHRPEFELATVDERTAHIGATSARILIESVQQNRRGVPEHPVVHQVDAEIHLGESLPSRTNR